MDTLEDALGTGWDIRTLNGPVRKYATLPHTNTEYVLEQDYCQNNDTFLLSGGIQLNTAHPEYPDFKLVAEGSPTITAGVRFWTATYAKVPDSHSEATTYDYNFIGYTGYIINPFDGSTTLSSGRPRFSRVVAAKLQVDYALVGIGGSYATQFNFPVINATKYWSNVSNIETQFIWNDVGGGGIFSQPSNPSLATYQGYITADGADVNSFSLVAQDSHFDRWMGNIIRRQTLYVKAI